MNSLSIAVSVLTVVALATAGNRYARRREHSYAQAMREAAAVIGWTYGPSPSREFIDRLRRRGLLPKGFADRFEHALAGSSGDCQAMLFEHGHGTLFGRGAKCSTVLYLADPSLQLPLFTIRPAGFLGRRNFPVPRDQLIRTGGVASLRTFLLAGRNADALRDVFTGEVASFFAERPDLCASGEGEELLLWRPGVVAGPDEVAGLVAEALELRMHILR